MKDKIENVIDLQNHIFPDFYIETMKNDLGIADCGGAPWPKWSLEKLIKTMDEKGIEKAFLSYSVPGVYFKSDQWSNAFAMRCNDYLADVVQKHPSRLGGFACLPLPDAEGATGEGERALDDLRLDGICLLSNVNGIYPGAEENRNLFSMLDKRGAVVFIHPNNPSSDLTKGFTNIYYGWFIDTTRALISLARSGFIKDFPNIKFVLAHGGGVYPAMMHLFKDLADQIAGGNIYVDTAKAVDFHNLKRLFSVVGESRVLFGSDYPMADKVKIDYWYKKLKSYFSGKDELLKKILCDNSKSLFASPSRTIAGGVK